jgi:putative RecB family exonuclease
MIDHLSASQIQLYMDCSLKYKFSKIDKLPKPFKPAGMALGSSVDATVEWLHQKWNKGQEVSLESVWDIFEADWYAQSMHPIRYAKEETEEDVLNVGKNLLSVYFEHAPRNDVIKTQFAFNVPLVDFQTGERLDISLVGIMDKIEKGDVVVDLKTWSRMISDDDLESNIQLSAYAYAYRVMYRKNPSLRLDVLLKTKKPRFEQLPAFRTEDDNNIFFNICKEVYTSIQKEVFFPNPSWKCRDCEYRQVCWFWNKNGKE